MSSPAVLPAGLARMAPHLLVIAHDEALGGVLLGYLSDAGYPTLAEPDPEAGLHAATRGQPDLVVLAGRTATPDIAELVSRLRAAVAGVAVLVVTCEADEQSVIATLDAGADDHLVNPAGMDILLARVRAVLRRGGEHAAPRPTLRLAGLCLDLAARRAELDDVVLSLSPREFDLLAYLALRVGQVVSKGELLAEVWRLPYSVADKTVDVHVSWLRRKLGESAQAPRYLHTVRGVGLRLDIPRS